MKLFVMGANYWRDEQDWPLARATYTKYYVSSGGRANIVDGDGTLSPDPPAGGAATDTFTYDPADPVPTVGGSVFRRMVTATQTIYHDAARPSHIVLPIVPLETTVTGFRK